MGPHRRNFVFDVCALPHHGRIALHREEKPMEEILREHEELTESELDEIAGGGGCCGGCGCGGISLELGLELSLCQESKPLSPPVNRGPGGALHINYAP